MNHLAAHMNELNLTAIVRTEQKGMRLMKTLIVEDEFTSRLLLQKILSRFGECHIAVNGEEAIKAFHMARAYGVPYSLICMDIQMPVMNGLEAVRQIRANETEDDIQWADRVKILMATSENNIKGVMDSYNAQCDAYFLKPINADSLLEKLRGMQLIA
jgi:two-component system chemotaxis response regulator CheY